MPNLQKEIKEIVNSGAWQLYKNNDPAGNYSLVANDEVYTLDNHGGLISKNSRKDFSIEAKSMILFADLISPSSLSNMV